MPPEPALPRYRGLTGAASYGLVVLLFICVLCGMAAAYFQFLTGNPNIPWLVAERIMTWGLAASVSAVLCRWIAGGSTDRLISFRTVRGDFAFIGTILGILAAGLLTKTPADSAPAIGATVEISGPTLDGKQFNLAEQRGSVVLVDFWATWCVPCREELPNIKDVYERNKDAGLKVVSVSLDNKKSALTEFLASHPLPWPQIFFDGKGQQGWDNPLAKKFGVGGIPFLMVIGKDGTIHEMNVRGSAIGSAVARALAGEGPSTQPPTTRLLELVYKGGVLSPPALLAGCTIGAALICLVLELLIRRVLGK